MPTTFSPLRSTHGFKSPGFEVSPTGELTVSSGGSITFEDEVIIDNSLYVTTQLFIDNVGIFESVPGGPGLSTSVTSSHLETLGILQELNVAGNVSIEDNLGNSYISVINGILSVESLLTGSIDNIDIGQTAPADGRFVDLDVDNNLIVTNNVTAQSVNVTTGTINNFDSTTGIIDTLNTITGNINTVNSTTINTDTVTVDDITISNTPVQAYHATRKDYVDNRITALSIALGA